MSHINYNHLYYFWHIYKKGSVVDAAEALYLTPQTITEQIKTLEKRLQGKLFKRKGRGLRLSESGESAFRYTDKMFTLSQEMLDIVNYRRESNLLSDVDVVNTLSKQLVSSVLNAAAVGGEQIYLCCFESTYGMLLDQLSQHRLDMIISDCLIGPTWQEGLFSVRIGECSVSFWCTRSLPEKPFLACLEECRLPVPGRRSILGRKLLNWINSQGLNVETLGESDDAALMKAFGAMYNATFAVPMLYSYNFYAGDPVVEIGRIEDVMEEYHAIFAGRMTQHPAAQRICSADYPALLTSTNK